MIINTLGHYAISTLIGSGGMGEVYQAKDQKLGRDVAIKVLPEELAQDAGRVVRFQREAKLLASLNHPNIAAIHGLEESDGTHFLVLELVKGDTLADRIKKGSIPVEESLQLALQIAEALEAAHEQGVIHRDLKPANIKVTPDGKVKVLDFGLAKAFARDQEEMILSETPTISVSETQKGAILGTPAYMSPEQASGKTVDRRADVWAFGVVLFEMLTGQPLFASDSFAQTLARVLEWQPDFSSLPPNLHPKIVEMLQRCLEKQVKNRYGSISDVRVDIQNALADPRGVLVQPVTAAGDRKKPRIGLQWVAAVFILGLILAGISVWKLKPTPPPEPKPVVRFEYELPEGQQFNTQIIGHIEYDMAVSPDGTQFAYSANDGLFLRSLNELTAKRIAGADKDTLRPFFSPDGKSIGYFNKPDMKWKMVPISGGTPQPLVDGEITGITPSWDYDDAFVYTDMTQGIMRVSARGGTPEILVEGNAMSNESLPMSPQMLPDGKSLLFTSGSFENPANPQIVVKLESGETRELFNGTDARYLPTGHIVYLFSNNNINSLYAVPFDLESLEETGDRKFLLEGVQSYAVSDSGTLVYVPQSAAIAEAAGATASAYTLVWVDRQGNAEPLGFPPYGYGRVSISPDGTQVATSYVKDGKLDIFILDLNPEKSTRLTFNNANDTMPLWIPDGQKILYRGLRGESSGIYWKAADGTGKEDLFFSGEDRLCIPVSWSGDGSALLMLDHKYENTADTDIGMLYIEADRKRIPLLQEKYNESGPQISPDGRWMAYNSDEFGRLEVFVRPFPNVTDGRWQISESGGNNIRWSPDGRELFYRNGDATMVVEVETEPTFKPGKPKVLFRGFQSEPYTIWDIHPNGKKFLMLKPYESATAESIEEEGAKVAQPKIIVVKNWFEELKERVAVE